MSENQNQELVSAADVEGVNASALSNELATMNSGKLSVFSTVQGTDFKSRVTVLDAMTNATPIADEIGKPFNLKDVIIQSVEMANERTGELQAVPRITFITDDGRAFHAISGVLYNDLKNIFAILGMPSSWPAALPLVVERIKGKQGHFFTARVAA